MKSNNIFIIGSAGKVGLRLVKLLSASKHQAIAMYRKPEQEAELKNTAAKPVLADLTSVSVEQLAAMMKDVDVIVFTAGAGGAGVELTNAIDGAGLELAVDAANLAGVRRFILISAFPEAGRTRETTASFEHYLAVKKKADSYLVASRLEWIILRPGRLTDEAGSGKVNAGLAITYDTISRDDVAQTLKKIIETPSLKHKIIELTQGGLLIESAINKINNYN